MLLLLSSLSSIVLRHTLYRSGTGPDDFRLPAHEESGTRCGYGQTLRKSQRGKRSSTLSVPHSCKKQTQGKVGMQAVEGRADARRPDWLDRNL